MNIHLVGSVVDSPEIFWAQPDLGMEDGYLPQNLYMPPHGAIWKFSNGSIYSTFALKYCRTCFSCSRTKSHPVIQNG